MSLDGYETWLFTWAMGVVAFCVLVIAIYQEDVGQSPMETCMEKCQGTFDSDATEKVCIDECFIAYTNLTSLQRYYAASSSIESVGD